MKMSFVRSLPLALASGVFFFTLTATAQLSLQVLHSFTGGADGQQPEAGLVQASDGALYGTTYLGGTNRAGTVFKVNPDGSGNTPIYQFPANKVDPFGLASPSGLIEGADGALYGTTGIGGSNGFGSVFRLNRDGSGFVTLHSFNATPPYGYDPTAALVQGTDGMLYGTTQEGGVAGAGTVFKLNTDGSGFAQVYTLGSGVDDPRTPQAPLLQGSDGALYGTSYSGGASAANGGSGYGTVFKVSPDGSDLTVLHSFLPSGGDGQRPCAGLVQGSDGTLYGTTQQGGSTAVNGSTGSGTVYRLNPDGTGFAILHNFGAEAHDGTLPSSALVIGVDGALYGTTEMGGSHNVGVVFRLNPDGSQYSLLYEFGSRPGDGANPHAPLVRASDGGLFGTAQLGGAVNAGIVFRLGPAPAVLSAVKRLADQKIQISLNGAPQFEYRIEGSADQVHWAPLTNLFNSTGVMQFTDPEAGKIPQRFYRAAWVP